MSTARRRARFRAWTAQLDTSLRRLGSRLILDAPHGASFETPPSFHPMSHGLLEAGSGSPSLTLRLGRDVHLGRGLTIEFRRDGDNVLELGDECYLQDSNRFVLAGGRIAMGARGRMRSFAVMKSSGELVMGDDVTFTYSTIVHCAERIDVGDMVTVSDRSTLIDSSHVVDGSDTHHYMQPTASTPITIGRNVLISANCMVLRGVHIEPNAFVAGGSILRKGRYPAGWLIGGDPAKPVKPLGPGAAAPS